MDIAYKQRHATRKKVFLRSVHLNTELNQRRRRRQRERQKSKQTRLAKQQQCKMIKAIDELKGGKLSVILGRNLPEEWQKTTFDYVIHKSKWKINSAR